MNALMSTVPSARCHGPQIPCSTQLPMIQKPNADASSKSILQDQFPLISPMVRTVLASLRMNVPKLTVKYAQCHGPQTLPTSSQRRKILTADADASSKDSQQLTTHTETPAVVWLMMIAPMLTVLSARCHGLPTQCSTQLLTIQKPDADVSSKSILQDQFPLISPMVRTVLASLRMNVPKLTVKYAQCHGPQTLPTSSQRRKILTADADASRKDSQQLTIHMVIPVPN